MLKVGDSAPLFKLPDQDGNLHKLSDLKGMWVFLYFYPEDDTPGCTTEACNVRDNLGRLTSFGVEVFGVSVDSVASHKKFQEKYHLNFPLLADEKKTVVQDFGVWVEKNYLGIKSMGIARTSFLIEPQGKIAKVYEKVKPEKHIEEVLGDLKSLT